MDFSLDEYIDMLEKEVVGERTPIKSILMTIASMYTENKDKKNSNIQCNGKAGIGKDYIVGTISKYFLPDNWIKKIAPTPASITLSQRDCEPNMKLGSDKILYIEDAGNRFLESEHFKLLINGDVNHDVVESMKTYHVKWFKPVVILTTATGSDDAQISRRLPSANFNDTTTQTSKIIKRKIDLQCGKLPMITDNEKTQLIDFSKSLKRVIVDITDVEDILRSESEQDNSLYMRSLSERLIDYIKFSAAWHQHDRKSIESEDPLEYPTVFATEEDFNNAKEVIDHFYKRDDSTPGYDILNQRQRNIVARMERTGVWSSIKEIDSWPESEDTTIQTTYNDVKRITKNLPHINCTGGYDAKYGVGEYHEN